MQPDAINFWMGGNRSITSTHKDPYENLYAVVRGSKTFTLFPPTCVPFMPYALFSLAKYQRVRPGLYDIVDVQNVDEDCDGGRCTSENINQDGPQIEGDELDASTGGGDDVNKVEDLKDQKGPGNIDLVLNGHQREGEKSTDLHGLDNVHDEATVQRLLDKLEMFSERKETMNKSELEDLRITFETVCGGDVGGNDEGSSKDLPCSNGGFLGEYRDNLISSSRPCSSTGTSAANESIENCVKETLEKVNNGVFPNTSDFTNEPSKIPWIACNPLKKDPKFKNFFENAKPVVATLYPGDLLYLPSLWFHHVQQENGTVAVNYWYDMSYDAKYVYFKFLEKLSQPHLNNHK